ncbi:VOC family protein [Paenibacillus sp. J2TS4]|uniref:VOC family protein n=1 Tax=Paenibacillus sp. J2TS4 TaxID=2807194 RepID=UPI001B13837A|nr:VOC family protein [Paenibacillus sp. J2TS4]GIP31129.1 glyoxalase [Paenibacillus sp. J2TS4]
MLNPTELHHVSLVVTDLEKSSAFYREVLGLKDLERPPFPFAGAWFAVGGSGQQLHLIVNEAYTPAHVSINTRNAHLAIRVPCYTEALAKLDQLKIEYVAKPNSIAGFPQVYILDPDHNLIEINAARLEG